MNELRPLIRKAIRWALFSAVPLIVGCGNQRYQLLPPGQDAELLGHCNVVVAATATYGNIAYDQTPIEQYLLPFVPMGVMGRQIATFHVERVLKGKRANLIVSFDNLALGPDGPIPASKGLFPVVCFQTCPLEYHLGYDFEFLGRYYGLKFMPVSDPRLYIDHIPKVGG